MPPSSATVCSTSACVAWRSDTSVGTTSAVPPAAAISAAAAPSPARRRAASTTRAPSAAKRRAAAAPMPAEAPVMMTLRPVKRIMRRARYHRAGPAMERTIAIYDDFAPDPDALRAEARAAPYIRSVLNPSNLISAASRHRHTLARRLARLADRPIAWAWHDGAGTYRSTTEADVRRTRNGFFAHSDGIIDHVCLLYLSPPKECHGGTTFCRHIETGLEGFHDLRAVE